MVRWYVVLVLTLALAGGGCGKRKDDSGAQRGSDATDALPARRSASSEVLPRGPWHWVATASKDDWVQPKEPQRYTVEFLPDSTVRVLLDCNTGSGPYHLEQKKIHIGPIVSTRMACPPGSLDRVFAEHLEHAEHWLVDADTLTIGTNAGQWMFLQR
jgi:heat shock protein HslJ